MFIRFIRVENIYTHTYSYATEKEKFFGNISSRKYLQRKKQIQVINTLVPFRIKYTQTYKYV